MATILTKKKDTSGAPSAGDLTNSTGGAELAVNTADKRLYTKDSGGNVVEVGINPTSITTGTLNTSGAVVFNDAGADVDFRVEGDTDANLLFVDASADAVGVGTNAPSFKWEVYGTTNASSGWNAGGTVTGFAQANTSNADFRFGTTTNHPIGLYTNATERMRIDTSGNVGIGTSSPVSKLDVTGTSTRLTIIDTSNASAGSGVNFIVKNGGTTVGNGTIRSDNADNMQFFNIGGERMRIDSSGYLYVNNMAVGGTANLHWSSANGQFFVTSSSRRFKHDIVDYDKGLAEVLQMQPKYFVYNQEPNQKKRAGFIAEDFHDLGMTEFVEYWKDENNQDAPSEIGYSNMVAVLVKAIQELKAELDAAKDRIAALEANNGV